MKFGDIKITSRDADANRIEWLRDRQIRDLTEKFVDMVDPEVGYLISYKFEPTEESCGQLALRATMNVEQVECKERVAHFCPDVSLILEPRVGLSQRLKNAWRYIARGGYQVVREEEVADECVE